MNKSLVVSLLAAVTHSLRIPVTRQWTEKPVTSVQKHMHALRTNNETYNETLTNSYDTSYTGTAFMGTPLQGNST